MPYISPERKKALDPVLEPLLQFIRKYANAGDLNYVMTRCADTALNAFPDGLRYGNIAIISGVIDNVGREFYRRRAVPYENKKIEENGDVYEFPDPGAKSIG